MGQHAGLDNLLAEFALSEDALLKPVELPRLVDEWLELLWESDGTDLIITAGAPPLFRVDGQIERIDDHPPLSPAVTASLISELMGPRLTRVLVENKQADFAFSWRSLARLRGNAFLQKGTVALALRMLPLQIPSMAELGLPATVQEWTELPRGFVLVTGPTGSGKSTTLASMISHINQTQARHIVTIEDPIEYYHPHKRCVVTQREVHVDVPSFSEAIRRALRQDPDIILVGEMRDLETIEAAISAAETGHLVFGTLHTNSAAKTIDRIVDAFPANMKDMIRTQLASSLVAVISQVLCKKIGGGRIAGYEIMVNTSSIASLIRENKTFRITSDIQTGANLGMITMDTHLMNLVNRELVSPDEVLEKAQDPVIMRDKLIAMGARLREV